MTPLFLAIASLLFTPQAPPAQEPKHEVSDKEGLEFARRIESDHAAGRESAFDDIVDLEGLVEEVGSGLDLTVVEKSDFVGGMRQHKLGTRIGAALGNTYTLLKTHRAGGRLFLTFRLWGPEGLNYHDLRIRKSSDGLRIADLRMYMSGEWMGQTIRRILMVVSASKPERAAKLPAWTAEWLSNWTKVADFTKLANSDTPREALALFERFPETVRKDRMVQTLRLRAASKVGDAEHVKASDEYARLFPEDGCRDLACLDGLILRKEFAKAFESVDRIGKAVGGDPILDVIRGRLHMMNGKFPPAREAALQAMKNLPKLQDPHWVLIEITLKEKKFAETVERLHALEKTLEVTVHAETMEADAEYADFVKSSEYREWKKSRTLK